MCRSAAIVIGALRVKLRILMLILMLLFFFVVLFMLNFLSPVFFFFFAFWGREGGCLCFVAFLSCFD